MGEMEGRALVGEVISDDELRGVEVKEGIDGEGDNTEGELVEETSPLEDVIRCHDFRWFPYLFTFFLLSPKCPLI